MIFIEAPESSSPPVIRAVAASLLVVFCNKFEIPYWKNTLQLVFGVLPMACRSLPSKVFQHGK